MPDTGGAGLHRGGNGVDVAYRLLEAGTIAIHDDRWLTYPWGVKGGEPRARGTKRIDRADGTRVVLRSKVPGDSVPACHRSICVDAAWGTSHKKRLRVAILPLGEAEDFVVFAAVAHVHLTRRELMSVITLNGDRGCRAARAEQ